MSAIDIPVDKAELLSALLEGLLYGISLPMFGGTIWALTSRRSSEQVNSKMLTVACMLLLFSTVHFIIQFVRVMDGLILLRDREGSTKYFSDVSQWSFVAKNYVYTAQTLIGDGVILYRCYAVWQSKLVMILPALLWCAVFATGIGGPYAESQVSQGQHSSYDVFSGSLSRWITSFWVSTLATNLLTTLLLAYRIWCIDRKATNLWGSGRMSQLRPVLRIILDAGAIYSLTLLAALICFLNKSNGQYVILDMITPIISITFYMVILRVVSANQTQQNTSPVGHTSTGNSFGGDRRSRMLVHTMTLTEGNAENGRRSSMGPTTLMGGENSCLGRISLKFDGDRDGEMV